MAEIYNKYSLRKWLQDQPKEVAVAIAARVALRVLPLMAALQSIDGDVRPGIVLSTSRAVALSWVAASYPTFGREVATATATAAVVAARIATSAAKAAANAASARANAAYAARAAATAASAARAAATAASAATADNAASARANAANAASAAASARSASANATPVGIWLEINGDINGFEASSVKELLIQPLWHNTMPEWAQKNWQKLQTALLQTDENWQVWTNWYQARLYPEQTNPCYAPPIESLELARALLPDDLWEQGPAAVNGRIVELMEENGCLKPVDPKQIIGPTFSMPDWSLEYDPETPAQQEWESARQLKFFARLKQRVAQLASYRDSLGNQYPELYNLLSDYAKELEVEDLQDIDVDMVWMIGAGLIEQNRAFDEMPENEVLTPALEPEVSGLLSEIARVHGAFVSGFAEGRELIERATAATVTAEELRNRIEQEREISGGFLALPANAMSEAARNVHNAVNHELALRGVQAENIARTVFPPIHN